MTGKKTSEALPGARKIPLNPDFVHLLEEARIRGLVPASGAPVRHVTYYDLNNLGPTPGLWLGTIPIGERNVVSGQSSDGRFSKSFLNRNRKVSVLISGGAPNGGLTLLAQCGSATLDLTPFVSHDGGIAGDRLKMTLQFVAIYGPKDFEPVVSHLLGLDPRVEETHADFFANLTPSPTETLLKRARLAPEPLIQFMRAYTRGGRLSLLTPPAWGPDLAEETLQFVIKYTRWPIHREEVRTGLPLSVDIPTLGGRFPYGVPFALKNGRQAFIDEMSMLFSPDSGSKGPQNASGPSLYRWARVPIELAMGPDPVLQGELPPPASRIDSVEKLSEYVERSATVGGPAEPIVEFLAATRPSANVDPKTLLDLGAFLAKEFEDYSVDTALAYDQKLILLRIVNLATNASKDRAIPLDMDLPHLLSYLYVQGLPTPAQVTRFRTGGADRALKTTADPDRKARRESR